MTQSTDELFSLRAVGRSAAILVSATLLVQVIGIIRELYVAAQVGLSADLDALIIGIALPVTVATILTAGIRPAMVPAYMDARDNRGRDSARRLAGTVFVWAIVAGGLMAVLLIVLAQPLVAIMGPGLDAAARQQAAGYLTVVAPAAVALAGSSVLFGACQAERDFIALAISTIIGPTTSLIIMLALWSQLGLDALAVGSLIGPFVAMSILLGAMWVKGISPRTYLRSTGLGLGALMRHATPLSISAAILQLNPIIDRAIATLITPGGVSALRFGDSLLRAPISAINAAWGTAIYPALVRASRDDGHAGLGASTERTVRFVIALLVPVALLAIAAAPTAVFVVYGRGEFGPEDVEVVARVLAAFAPMITIIIANEVLTSALNARRRGSILLAAGALNVTLNLIFDIVFGISFGIVGIALSSSLTTAVVTIWKARRFRSLEVGISLRALTTTLLRALAAAAPASLLIFAWVRWSGLPPNALVGLVELALFALVGFASYGLLATRLGIDEPRLLADVAVRGLRSRSTARGRPR